MDQFPWQQGPSGPNDHNAGLNLLDDTVFLPEIDDQTLQCVLGGVPLPPSLHDGNEPGPLPEVGALADDSAVQTTKRRRAAANDFNTWLSTTFAKSEDNDAGTAGSGDGEVEDDATATAPTAAGGARRTNKRGRPMSEAALAKADRERARRERLNDLFDELSRLCDPSGKASKGDRVSIVVDAIRVVQQLRVENNQLRQLNKFMEERCGQYERSRAQAMYQQVGMHPQAAEAIHFPQYAGMPAASAAASVMANGHPQQQQHQYPQMQQQQQQQQQKFQHVPMSVQGTTADVAGPGPASGPATVQHVLVSVPIDSQFGQQVLKNSHAITQGMPTAVSASLPPGAPPASWLPAPDVSEDQKLRPPAA